MEGVWWEVSGGDGLIEVDRDGSETVGGIES